MAPLRRQIRAYPRLAALILAAALLLRILVPAGFMPDFSGGTMQVTICTGYGPAKMMAAMPMNGGQSDGNHQGKHDMPCGFAGLGMPGLGGADQIQLALAILFIMAAGLALAPRPILAGFFRLRPPLRAPPVIA